MGDYLTELGYRVSKALSGNSALTMLEEDPCDIIVTDIRMPDGDGQQLIKSLRSLDPNLPIIVVTGHIGTTESLEEEAEGRYFAMLKKPISLAVMAETLEQLLQSL
jgi:DNA-binding NtrC family response regulator